MPLIWIVISDAIHGARSQFQYFQFDNRGHSTFKKLIATSFDSFHEIYYFMCAHVSRKHRVDSTPTKINGNVLRMQIRIEDKKNERETNEMNLLTVRWKMEPRKMAK